MNSANFSTHSSIQQIFVNFSKQKAYISIDFCLISQHFIKILLDFCKFNKFEQILADEDENLMNSVNFQWRSQIFRKFLMNSVNFSRLVKFIANFCKSQQTFSKFNIFRLYSKHSVNLVNFKFTTKI
jgi:hypothetical protein